MEHGATFGEVLRAAGYRTIISGKWHQRPLPITRGFDRYCGLADGCCNYWNPGIKARPGEGKPARKRKSPRRWAIEGKCGNRRRLVSRADQRPKDQTYRRQIASADL
jgi:arylsulfatase